MAIILAGVTTDGGVPTDDIRAALIEAAAEVFAEEGYSGARVQSIAERAGLTTGAIYNRFSGKSELLLEALDRSFSPSLSSAQECLVGCQVVRWAAFDLLLFFF